MNADNCLPPDPPKRRIGRPRRSPERGLLPPRLLPRLAPNPTLPPDQRGYQQIAPKAPLSNNIASLQGPLTSDTTRYNPAQVGRELRAAGASLRKRHEHRRSSRNALTKLLTAKRVHLERTRSHSLRANAHLVLLHLMRPSRERHLVHLR
jgi:hypothetical protein